ncbi:MAG: hypothetical protein WDW36_003816 [Sanguina aurantia]
MHVSQARSAFTGHGTSSAPHDRLGSATNGQAPDPTADLGDQATAVATVEQTPKPLSKGRDCRQQVMLLLVGPPGSGKSTLSASLVQRSSLSWAVVNQDTIKGGSPGTRKQCLSAARRALSSGDCCVIDRCNFDPDQRGDFLQLAASMHVPVHAVLLNLPVEVCVQRAVGRINHPSKVHGPMAVGIVRNVFNQIRAAGPPSAQECLASVMDCSDPADVAVALDAWCLLGAGSSAAPAANAQAHPSLAGDTTAGTTTAAARSEELATAAAGGATAAEAAGAPGPAAAATPAEQASGTGVGGVGGGPVSTATPWQLWSKHLSTKPVPKKPCSMDSHSQRTSPAGPSPGGAARSGSQQQSWQQRPQQQQAGQPQQQQQNPQQERQPYQQQQQQQPRQQQHSPQQGQGQYQQQQPAQQRQQQQPPNQQQQQQQQPRHGFQSSQEPQQTPPSAAAPASSAPPPCNALSMLMASASRNSQPAGAPSSSSRGGTGSALAGAPAAALQQGSFVFAKMPWTEALRSIVRRPEAFRNEHPELFIDGECIMFDDKYPKARFHQLVIPRDQSLESIYDLQARHVPLLQHMMAVAQAQSPQQHGGCSMGFHAVPSMRQLHMHVISQDYDSPALKHAKHWNSFTTAYFLPVDQVISTLQLQGSIPMDIATYEKAAKGAMNPAAHALWGCWPLHSHPLNVSHPPHCCICTTTSHTTHAAAAARQ